MAKIKVTEAPATQDVGGNIPIGSYIAPAEPSTADAEFAASAATTIANTVDKGMAVQERGELDKKFREIKRLRTAADQGKISFEEARTRASAAVKTAINAMPWRAKEFREQAGTFFGAYGEGWGVLNKTADEDAASSFEQSLKLHYFKMLQTHTGKPSHAISNGDMQDMAVLQAVSNQAELAQKTLDMGNIDKTQALNYLDQITRPMVTNTTLEVSKYFNQFQIDGKSVTEMMNEGVGSEAIINKLLRDDTKSKEFADGVLGMLRKRKAAISAFYDNKVAALGSEHSMYFDSTQVQKRKEAALKDINMLIEDVTTDSDKKALARFVTNLETANKGRVEGFSAANMNFMLAKKSGFLTDDAITRFIEFPDSIRDPNLKAVLENASANLNFRSFSNWTDQIINVPSSYDILNSNEPEIATLLDVRARSTMPAIMSLGFSNDPQDAKKQKDWFVTASYIHLFKTSPNNPRSITEFEKVFFDDNYQKRFKELSPEQRGKIIQPVRQKIASVLWSDNENGVIQRAISNLKDLKGATDVELTMDSKGHIKASAIINPNDIESTSVNVSNTLMEDLDRLNKYVDMFEAVSPNSQDMQKYRDVVFNALQSVLKDKE